MHDRKQDTDFVASDPVAPKLCSHDPRVQCTCEADDCECPLDQRRDCPWQCALGEPTCVCVGLTRR